jgi:hypothetical protein
LARWLDAVSFFILMLLLLLLLQTKPTSIKTQSVNVKRLQIIEFCWFNTRHSNGAVYAKQSVDRAARTHKRHTRAVRTASVTQMDATSKKRRKHYQRRS